MKNIVSKFYILAFYLCSTTLLLAQPGDTGDGTGGLEGGDAPAPIDNYVWVLALVGLFFVFMKFKAYQKANATFK
jgi:hypothetical protein